VGEREAKRIYEVHCRQRGRRCYVDTLLAWTLEEAGREARAQHGDDVIVTDVLAERRRARGQMVPTEEERVMKKAEVEVGGRYTAKVSGKVVPVRIDAEHSSGDGWIGTNMETGREVRIKTARRLRERLGGPKTDDGGAQGAAGAKKSGHKTKGAKGKKKAAGAKSGAAGKGKSAASSKKASAKKAPMSGLDAAARVLEEAGEPLNCKAIVERAFEKGYWASDGKTPQATIYSAIIREIGNKGKDARFRKVDRGKFALTDGGAAGN